MQGEVSFSVDPRYGRELSTTRASAVIVEDKASLNATRKLGPRSPALRSITLLDFARNHRIFHAPQEVFPGNSSDAVVPRSHGSAKLPHRAPRFHPMKEWKLGETPCFIAGDPL